MKLSNFSEYSLLNTKSTSCIAYIIYNCLACFLHNIYNELVLQFSFWRYIFHFHLHVDLLLSDSRNYVLWTNGLRINCYAPWFIVLLYTYTALSFALKKSNKFFIKMRKSRNNKIWSGWKHFDVFAHFCSI